jgi:glyoxylase-like metal-dependent hydrolase (beta-lactamase superfamily II)
VDEFDGGFGWIADEFLERCSHALVADGRVWLIDPVAAHGIEERIRAAGEPAGVIQLLDRHSRDCTQVAARLGVAHHMLPQQIAGAPFEFLTMRDTRWWKEVALWWAERSVLVCADVLGTARYYCARDERIALHPFMRLRPPRKQLERLAPERILCGHGEGVHAGADAALREALRTARRRIPAQLVASVRAWRQER